MPTFVVVEDDLMLAEIYQTSLQSAGHTCVVAYDGKTALTIIQQNNPDLVLLDLMLPEISGDEVLRQMRLSDWGKDVKVIITTNISEAEAPEILKTLKFERYIIKANTGPNELIAIAEQTIGV
jgi:DNA-binding response OmpR family regulator